jgi:hypothetical protein
MLVALRLRVIEEDTISPEWLFVPPLLGLLVGIIWGLTRIVSILPLLRLLEQSHDLKDRLSTALQYTPSTDAIQEAFLQRQRTDAESTVGHISIAKVLPLWPLHQKEWGAMIAAGGAFLLYFLPTLPVFQSRAERAEHEAIKKDGERIVQVAQVLEKLAVDRKWNTARQAAQKMVKLGEEMKKGHLSRQKALMKAARLTEEIRQAQQAAAGQATRKSLPSAAKELSKALTLAGNTAPEDNKETTPSLSPPQSSSGKSGDSHSSHQTSNTALKQIQNAMARNDSSSLAESLSRLADDTAQGHPNDKAGRENLATKLDKLAKSLEGTSLSNASEPLRQAAESLRSGNMSQAAANLREASRRTTDGDKQANESQAMQRMEESLSGNDSTLSEGDTSDSGEGVDKDDAFAKNGIKKEHHVHTKECLQPGGT